MRIIIDTSTKTAEPLCPANYEEFTALVDKIAEALQWPPDAVQIGPANPCVGLSISGQYPHTVYCASTTTDPGTTITSH